MKRFDPTKPLLRCGSKEYVENRKKDLETARQQRKKKKSASAAGNQTTGSRSNRKRELLERLHKAAGESAGN